MSIYEKYRDMMAISLWEPWAWLVVHGHKPIETRTWCPPYRLAGKRIAIHAAKKVPSREVLLYIAKWAGQQGIELPSLTNLPRGRVVGSVQLKMVREYSDADMFFEDSDLHLCDRKLFEPTKYGWEFTEPEFEAAPFIRRGQQGFFPALDPLAGVLPS